MRKITLALAVIGCGVLAASNPSIAGLTEAAELEHARANARAGGPVSERDAEFLDRWGCLSGTNSSFCKKQHRQTNYRPDRRRYR